MQRVSAKSIVITPVVKKNILSFDVSYSNESILRKLHLKKSLFRNSLYFFYILLLLCSCKL